MKWVLCILQDNCRKMANILFFCVDFIQTREMTNISQLSLLLSPTSTPESLFSWLNDILKTTEKYLNKNSLVFLVNSDNNSIKQNARDSNSK